MMTITNFEQMEWSRCANAMYAAHINWAGHRLSALASLPAGSRIPCRIYDDAARMYRAWLVFGELPGVAA